MSPETFVVLSGALTFGAPMLFALRELREVRRRPPSGGGGPSPDPVVEPPKPKPLPDCLIPKLGPRPRVREFEDA